MCSGKVADHLCIFQLSLDSPIVHLPINQRIGKANDNNEKAKAKRRIVEEKWQRIKDEEA